VDAALAPLGVHATHDAILHRLPRAGDVLLTSARVTAVERRRSGVLVVTRFTTVDHQGAVVTTTDYGSLYRGVELAAGAPGDHHAGREAAGAAREPRPEAPHPASSSSVAWTEPVAISAQASHVYTECARIWNPIHTDVAVAKAAGLDAPILHGTATLALAVSRVIARELAGDPARVRRITVRFTGMVAMPSTIVVRGLGVANGSVAFDAIDAEGRAILAGGRLATTP
jgi:acyl dehydratase